MGGGAAPIAGAVEFGGGFWGGGMVWGPLVVVWLAIAAIATAQGADLLQPIVTQGDADLWEAMGYFFAQGFRLWPWPHLELVGDGAFFPTGVNHVFQAWGVERDLFYGLLYRLGGPGPWLRWYYLLSVALTLGGMGLLLERCWGLTRRRAIAIAAIAVLFNGYGHGDKFPYHANIALIHWTVLGLVLDGAIARRAVRGQGINLRWVLGRLLLLILSLGQDLGYIAGFGLLWATLTAPYALGWWIWWGRSRPLGQRIRSLGEQWGAQLGRDRGVWLLLGAIVIFSWLYLPVVAQIFFAAKSFDFGGTYGRDWWFSPWRLLLPWLPGIDPISLAPEWSAWLGDRAESSRDGAVGWFLLILALVGLGQGRRSRSRWASWGPLLVGLALAIAYRPLDLPTLQLFPWFSFNRVGGRVTVLLPTIFALLAAEVRWPRLAQSTRSRPWFLQRGAIAACLLLLLGAVELTTMYAPAIARPSTAPDPALLRYLEVVRHQPGSAVLDWPFCATGGNGVGADGGLCPYFGRNPSLHSLARFHRKKVMGHYFGRLHPDQIAPYLAQGWQYLFLPNSPDYLEATAQRRCFRDDEWQFFEQFYRDRAHDFAGINLYVDLLPDGCAAQFHQRFGPAIATAQVPGMGQVEFLAMPIAPPSSPTPSTSPPPQIHQFQPPYDGQETDLVTFGPVRGIAAENLDRPRRDRAGTLFRWSLGTETRLGVTLDRPQTLELVLDAIAIAPDLRLTITLNGTAIAPQTIANPGDRLTLRLPLDLPAGTSAIALEHPNPIRLRAPNPDATAAGDRPIALQYQRLDLRPRTGNAP